MNKARTKKPVFVKEKGKFDGFVKVYDSTSLKDYNERLLKLERTLFELEEKLAQLEEILLMDRA
jgi:hypothetical protein